MSAKVVTISDVRKLSNMFCLSVLKEVVSGEISVLYVAMAGVNEYNNQLTARGWKSLRSGRLYVRAYNHKIIPVFLTTLSTVLGLVPFLVDGPEEETFWFSFAIGTSGGLLFSILALMFVMPIFMPLRPVSASGRYTVKGSCRTSP